MNNQFQLEPPPEAFVQPMLELRDFYAHQVENYEKLLNQALDQLNHVQALLSNWSNSTDTTSSITASSESNLSLPRTEIISEPLINTAELDTKISTDIAADTKEKLTTTQDNDISQLSLEKVASGGSNADQKKPSPTNETETISYSDIPMLPEYQHLTRTEAIQKLLQEYVGTVCHIDFIVLKLYGELEPEQFKVVKGRVQSTLTHGKETNKWSLVPGQPGCYTLVLSLIPTSGNSSSSKNSKNRKPSPLAQTNIVPMLDPYKGQFLIDALTSLFKENPGEVFNVAEVIEELYGQLNPEQLREIKPKVLNELSRGHRIGRFSRVPQEIGLYTWDAKLLQS